MGRRPRGHDCDDVIRRDAWASDSNHRQPGDRWTCSCGQQYEHDCDEAEGCAWLRVEPQHQEVAHGG